VRQGLALDRRVSFALIAVATLCAAPAITRTIAAQDPAPLAFASPTPPAAATGATFEFWGGLAGASPALGFLGDTPGMNFGVFAMRWSRWLGGVDERTGIPRYEISFDLIPVARISPPLESVDCPGPSTCVPAGSLDSGGDGFFPEKSPFGLGINALGLTRRFSPRRGISPSLGATLGALLFEERVPTTHASAFNFLLGVEAGVRIGDPSRQTILLTYRALHLSNAGMRHENPGVFWHTISAGIRYPR
jgi:hypothetical protein